MAKKKRTQRPPEGGKRSPRRDLLARLLDLDSNSLREWLQGALWNGAYSPLSVPPNSSFAPFLTDLLSSPKATSVRFELGKILPNIVRSWNLNDPPEILEDILLLCGVLRALDTERHILLLASERLRRHPEEERLRRECLRALSGLGCSEVSKSVFEHFLHEPGYSAICYRALYRYDKALAATLLPDLIEALSTVDRSPALDMVFKLMFFRTLLHSQRKNFLGRILNGDSSELERILQLLERNGVQLILDSSFRSDDPVAFVWTDPESGDRKRIPFKSKDLSDYAAAILLYAADYEQSMEGADATLTN
ncbi:MAG: hypothetical protein K0U98_03790 [Deltaproteobacteria bacterium]|nr:hypothetical protein [Deltaproteobacteria bacterium]